MLIQVSFAQFLTNLYCVGLLERMQDLDFDQDEDEMDWPEPPDIDQMKNDELYDLQPPGSGQIRISLQWIYSKVKLLKDILMHLRFQIRRDKLDKQLKQQFLEEMQQPFGGFLNR